MRLSSWRTVAFLFCTLVLPMVISAQQVAGVTGIVTDHQGKSIAGAEVTLSKAEIGYSQTAKTNEDGVYLFQKVQPGPNYKLIFTKEGFASVTLASVYLGVNTTSTQNAQMDVGSVTQTVEVNASGETLNTTDASVGNVLNVRTMHELPTLNRDDVTAFLRLEPGVVSAGGDTTISDPNNTRDGVVTGARVDQGNITVDGIDANDQNTGQAFTTVGNASVDAIQEIRTVTADSAADLGRSSGAQIALTTRSGSNNWHGNAREYNRNSYFGANSFFNNKNGVPLSFLNFNQFGASLGGPIRKDKLFFFFDYEGHRLASQVPQEVVVPYDDVRIGSVAYINNGPGCTAQSRRNTQPSCITVVSPAGVTGFDPQGSGPNAGILNLFSLYPHVNDPAGGDGVNFGGAHFNAPARDTSDTYTSRIDYNITSKQKLFGRFNIVREDGTQTPANLPGQPDATVQIFHDYSYALGHTYTLGPNDVNQFIFGVTENNVSFPSATLFKNFITLNTVATNPQGNIGGQFRVAPVPTIRDDYSHVQGRHNLGFGFNLRPFHTHLQNVRDFNFISVGLGGNLGALSPNFRPADILTDPARDPAGTAVAGWDQALVEELGLYASISTNYNYNKSGTNTPLGTGKLRTFKQRELEIYAQDSWRIKPNLTFGYGLRWQYEGVPFEENGFETVAQNVPWRTLLAIRTAHGLNGDPTPAPFLQYNLAGPVNHGPSYYGQYFRNFSPHLSLAYTPAFKEGPLRKLLGDNKTVLRLGGSIVYDRFAAGAFNFIQDQFTYLFQNSPAINFGTADPLTTLQTAPRFTDPNGVPQQPQPIPITHPLTPFVTSGGFPFGTATNQVNYALDPKFRTPYAYVISAGFQRQLPGDFQLEVDYVGRFAHALFAGADAGQFVDFKDPASGQLFSDALNKLATQLRTNAPITNQPFFENQVANPFGFPSSTALLVAALGPTIQAGNFTTVIQRLVSNGLISTDVGLSGQFLSNLYGANVSASSYNGLLASLRKRLSRNLQFDFNYAFSHSLDNSSFGTNAFKSDVGIFAPTICNALRPRDCRGNSEFDATHIINANGIYDLPFGKGQRFASNVNGLLNAVVGGWRVSTIFQAHTGFAMNIIGGVFPNSALYDSNAVLVGRASALGSHIHNDGGNIQFFSNPTAAQNAFSEPLLGQSGNRNIGRGPGYWNFDTAVVKDFSMPWSESQKIQFRWETFNTFNHPNFAEPTVDLAVPSSFGIITNTVNGGRVMLFGLRYDF